jgi:hypothetical protein
MDKISPQIVLALAIAYAAPAHAVYLSPCKNSDAACIAVCRAEYARHPSADGWEICSQHDQAVYYRWGKWLNTRPKQKCTAKDLEILRAVGRLSPRIWKSCVQ